MDAVPTGFVARRRDDTAPTGISADDEGQADEGRVVPRLDRGVETVHVAVEDPTHALVHRTIVPRPLRRGGRPTAPASGSVPG